MELKLDTYVPQSVMFSSEISTLVYSTDLEKIVVEIYIPSANYAHLLNTTLYAIDGKVTIYDIKELVEQYMRDKKIAYLEFGVEVYNEGGEVVIITAFKVLFCSFKPTLSATTYTRFNFLTSQRAKLLDFFVCYEDDLLYYAENGEDTSYTLTFVYTTKGGETLTEQRHFNSSATKTGIHSVYFDFFEYYSTYQDEKGALLKAITCKMKNRMFTYYLTEKAPDLYFRFYNAFNHRDFIPLYGKTTTKMKTQKSEAVCGGETAYYDCNSEKLYEFESERLTPDMMQWLEELLTSHYVTKNGSASSRVLITDYTYEVADDDTEKYIAKFTWKYADNRLTLEKPYEGNAKVFTQQFKDTFQ